MTKLDLNAQDGAGDTALHLVINSQSSERLEMLKALIATNRVDFEVKAQYRLTALQQEQIKLKDSDPEIIEILEAAIKKKLTLSKALNFS